MPIKIADPTLLTWSATPPQWGRKKHHQTTWIDAKQPHWMSHEPNGLREIERIITPLALKPKRCVHRNKAKEDPNGKL